MNGRKGVRRPRASTLVIPERFTRQQLGAQYLRHEVESQAGGRRYSHLAVHHVETVQAPHLGDVWYSDLPGGHTSIIAGGFFVESPEALIVA